MTGDPLFSNILSLCLDDWWLTFLQHSISLSISLSRWLVSHWYVDQMTMLKPWRSDWHPTTPRPNPWWTTTAREVYTPPLMPRRTRKLFSPPFRLFSQPPRARIRSCLWKINFLYKNTFPEKMGGQNLIQLKPYLLFFTSPPGVWNCKIGFSNTDSTIKGW